MNILVCDFLTMFLLGGLIVLALAIAVILAVKLALLYGDWQIQKMQKQNEEYLAKIKKRSKP